MTRKKILIIDDDNDDREIFCEALAEVASDSVCYDAGSGRKAMAALENREIEVPDLIFLDVNMPLMSGWQVLAVIKEIESFKNIPVIMYSTSSFPEDVEKAQDAGALCFFTKPSNYNQLKKSLELVVDHLNMGSLTSLLRSSPLFLTR